MGLLEASPDLRADTTMGVIVGRFSIHYDDFDDATASGKIITNGSQNVMTYIPDNVGDLKVNEQR